MKTLARISKTKSQKTEIKSQRSSFEEYPLIRAASTASESMRMIRSEPINRSLKVSRARIGAIISTGTIWVMRGIHFLMTRFGTISENCKGAIILRSKITAPTLSESFSFFLGSGAKPSVKITASESFSARKSIGLGGPSLIKPFQCLRDLLKASSKANKSFEVRAYCLSEMDRRKALPSFPQSWLAPNISLPLSLPAEPGSRTFVSRMRSISSISSDFLDSLIKRTISWRS